MKIVAMIPARQGSKRVPNKNMRLLNGLPLISYSIQAAKNSTILSDIYVNSDSNEIGEYGETLGAKYYKRSEKLASDTATSDEYNYDFFKSIEPDLLVQVNPVCPMVTAKDIDETIQYFIDKKLDSLVTVREERLQAFCDGRAINFDPNKQLPRTQDIPPILICTWPICIWKKAPFMNSFEEKGHAVFSGNFDLYPVSFFTSIKISYEADFKLAEKLIRIIK
jgi:CMP-N-acetylneuraminic acid synthetase